MNPFPFQLLKQFFHCIYHSETITKRGSFYPFREQRLAVVHTFITCSSFKPRCIISCISLSSFTCWCSLKASFVLRLAYSLKLYDANWLDCLRRERNWLTGLAYTERAPRDIRLGGRRVGFSRYLRLPTILPEMQYPL